MLKFSPMAAVLLFVGLGLTNGSPLRAQEAQPVQTILRTLPHPRAASTANTQFDIGQNSSAKSLEVSPIGPPPAVTLGIPTQLRPPPKVTLGMPTQLRPPPMVTLGMPTQQRPQPQVMLGLPESLAPGKAPTRFVSEGPSLSELAMPPSWVDWMARRLLRSCWKASRYRRLRKKLRR